jgi:hypothetical protein
MKSKMGTAAESFSVAGPRSFLQQREEDRNLVTTGTIEALILILLLEHRKLMEKNLGKQVIWVNLENHCLEVEEKDSEEENQATVECSCLGDFS